MIFRISCALAITGAVACSVFSSAPLQAPILNPDLVQRGGLIFLDPKTSANGDIGCATCHPGGSADGLVHRGRRTRPLRALWQSAPYLADGSAKTVRAAIESMLRQYMGSATVSTADLDALEAYVLSIPAYDNGRVEADGTPVEPATLTARRGFEVYVEAGCAKCHAAPSYTHRFNFNVDTDGKWQPPSLRGLKHAAPYGHDGRWETLEDAVDAILKARDLELGPDRKAWLMSYLQLL